MEEQHHQLDSDDKDPNYDKYFGEIGDIDEQDIIDEFGRIYREDKDLQQMLGSPENYNVEEMLSIVQAYKKGGGIEGLAEIIDEDGDDDDQQHLNGAQGGQGDNMLQQRNFNNANGDQGEEEDVDVEINLDDPEDQQLIEQEFKKLYERDEQFRTSFGQEAFELAPLQKYQIIDAYNQNGMEAVIALLSQSQEESDIMKAIDGQNRSDANLDDDNDESIIQHKGVKYQKI